MCDISVYAQTDVGKVRKGNEDNFLVIDITSEHLDSLSEVRKCNLNDKSNFFMVADGMGGPEAGEVASLLAVSTVLHEMQTKAVSTESGFIQVLDDLLQKANSAIFEKAGQHPEMRGMGTTATLAGILNNKLYIGQAGDSRAYIIRKNIITQLTKDQSYVNHLVESGSITSEEAENHPQKNVILQALGAQASLTVAITSVELYRDDYLLLCSDGLSGLVKKEEMKIIVQSSSCLATTCKKLIDLTNKRGGRDNITLIIVHFSSKALSVPDNDETIEYETISEFKLSSV